MGKSETAIVPVSEYALAQLNPAELQEVIESNLGGGQLNAFDLDRIKCPTGGQLVFTVPGLEGETYQNSITGVVVYWRDDRAFWKKNLDDGGGGAPPDCIGRMVPLATGGKQWMGAGDRDGDGNLGPHDCAFCKWNQFGSADKGEGKKCKETRLLAILTADSLLPTIINVPPTSLKGLRRFFLQLLAKRTPYYGAQIALSLIAATNKGGIKYAEIVPSLVSRLEGPELENVKKYQEMIRPAMEQVEAQAPAAGDTGSSFADDDDLETVDDGDMDEDTLVGDEE